MDEPIEQNEIDFYQQNMGKLIVTQAYGDWRAGVPRGMVYGIAVLNGNNNPQRHIEQEEKYFYIKKEQYSERNWLGYVIREGVDLELAIPLPRQED